MSQYRVVIISETGKVMSKNCDIRSDVDQFILENNARKFRIKHNDTVIETDKGIVEQKDII